MYLLMGACLCANVYVNLAHHIKFLAGDGLIEQHSQRPQFLLDCFLALHLGCDFLQTHHHIYFFVMIYKYKSMKDYIVKKSSS